MKPGMRGKGVVDIGRGKIEKEGFVFVGLNPIYRFAGQRDADLIVVVEFMGFLGAADLIDVPFFFDILGLRQRVVDKGVVFIETDHAMVFDIYERRVAIHHRPAEIVVEAEFQRSRFEVAVPIRRVFAEAEMPLADARGGITIVFHQISHGLLMFIDDQSHFEEHRRPVILSEGVFTREQTIPRGGAHGRCRVSVGETAPLTRELVNVGRADLGRPINAGVPIAEVVGENDDNVGLILREADQGGEQKE